MAQLIYRVPLFSIFWRKKSQYKTQTVILSFNFDYQYSHTTYEGNYMYTSHLLLVVAKQQAINCLPSPDTDHVNFAPSPHNPVYGMFNGPAMYLSDY